MIQYASSLKYTCIIWKSTLDQFIKKQRKNIVPFSFCSRSDFPYFYLVILNSFSGLISIWQRLTNFPTFTSILTKQNIKRKMNFNFTLRCQWLLIDTNPLIYANVFIFSRQWHELKNTQDAILKNTIS